LLERVENNGVRSCSRITLNGIEDIVGRGDLAYRSIFLMLGAIPETKRRATALATQFYHSRSQSPFAEQIGIVVGTRSF
jgi:hypothetical protein